MAETKAKKPAAPKAAAPAKKAPAAKKPAAAKAPAKKVVENGITVTQIGSPIGRVKSQEATLKGLGLNKLHRTRTLEDTPAIRGMIAKVAHMLKIESK